MGLENSEAGAPAAGGGARTLGQESDEVKRIGELLRTGKAPAKGGEDAKANEAGAGADDGDAVTGADEGAALGAGDEGSGEDEAGAGDDAPLSLGELAKSLGVKEGELFDGVKVEVEVTQADGTKGREAVSLGELRRGFVGARKLEHDREAFEADADKRSLEFMQARAQLELLGELVAPHAPREVVERMHAQLGQREARERALLLEAVPEWKDGARFTADRANMIEFLKPWGFSPADVYGIADHRIARFVRDMARAAGRKAEAERKARAAGNGEVKRGQVPDGRVGVVPLRAKLAKIVQAGKASKTTEGKSEAIGALLRTTQRK